MENNNHEDRNEDKLSESNSEETTQQCVDSDRLSDLPDSVLHQILSFLPTLSIVRSSSLSSHWRRLSLDHLRHASSFDFGDDFSRLLPRRHDFSSAVSSLLRLHSSPRIRRFRLTFNPGAAPSNKSAASRWIHFAASRSVEDLDLDFCCHIRHHFLSAGDYVIGRSEAFELPSAALSSCAETLARLSLSRCILAVLPDDLSGLRRLRSLSLRDVHVTNSMLETLLCNSFVLEELVLRECGSLTRIRVDSLPSLETLTVYECPNASSVEVSGRRIRSVLLSAGHLDSCVFDDVEMLEEAFIGTRGDEFGGVLYIFMEALACVSHVNRLALYLGHLVYFDLQPSLMKDVPSLMKDFGVNFSNLRELELVNSPLFGLFSTDVFCFFNHCNCPVLEIVTVELCTISNNDDSVLEFRTPKIKPPKCAFNFLKNVKLINFGNNKTDVELAAYFLIRAPVLDVMMLVAPRRSSDMNKCTPSHVHDAILRLPKSSSSARIVVGEGDERDRLLDFLRKHHVADVYYR